MYRCVLPPDSLQRITNDRIALRTIGEVVAQAVSMRVRRQRKRRIDRNGLGVGRGEDGGTGEGGPRCEGGREVSGGGSGGVVLVVGGASKLGAVEVVLLAIASECLYRRR